MRHSTGRAALAAFLVLAAASPGLAENALASAELFPSRSRVWDRFAFPPAQAASADVAPQTSPAPKLAAVEYSDAYKMRAKIHRYSSYAMLPLFATELMLGQSLYNTPSDGKRNAHLVVGSSIGVLFGINTVTGAWNLWEGRKDPNGRTLRLAHGLLMMASDVGFLATAATGPGHEDFGEFENSRSTHRAIAITSIATATAGYLVMLIGGH
jgi:hypothetical protein